MKYIYVKISIHIREISPKSWMKMFTMFFTFFSCYYFTLQNTIDAMNRQLVKQLIQTDRQKKQTDIQIN